MTGSVFVDRSVEDMLAALPEPQRAMIASVSESLRSFPGATELRLFGSLATGAGDDVSDIDLDLRTTDHRACRALRHRLRGGNQPVAYDWTIVDDPSQSAGSLVFAGTSSLHKIDLGFVQADDDAGVPSISADGVTLWRQAPAVFSPSSLPPAARPYCPPIGTPEHAALEQVLGVTRYVKARIRGHPLVAYRFATALVAAAFVALHHHRCGVARSPYRLTTLEYKALDAAMSPEERRIALDTVDHSSPETMDRTVHVALRTMLDAMFVTVPADLTTLAAAIDDEFRQHIEPQWSMREFDTAFGRSFPA